MKKKLLFWIAVVIAIAVLAAIFISCFNQMINSNDVIVQAICFTVCSLLIVATAVVFVYFSNKDN